MFRGFRYIRSRHIPGPVIEKEAKLEQEKDARYYELLAGEYTEESEEANLWFMDANYTD